MVVSSEMGEVLMLARAMTRIAATRRQEPPAMPRSPRRRQRAGSPTASDHGPDHRHMPVRSPNGDLVRPADLVVNTVPDPDRPNTPATIRRARVRDPVRAMVAAGAPYRMLLAAERFRQDIERAAASKVPSQLRPRITIGNGGGDPVPTNALLAQARVAKAWQAVGLVYAGIMSWCVVPKPASAGHTFGTIDGYAECRNMRRQRASDLLQDALTRLADHYQLGHPETPRELRLTREGERG